MIDGERGRRPSERTESGLFSARGSGSRRPNWAVMSNALSSLINRRVWACVLMFTQCHTDPCPLATHTVWRHAVKWAWHCVCVWGEGGYYNDVAVHEWGRWLKHAFTGHFLFFSRLIFLEPWSHHLNRTQELHLNLAVNAPLGFQESCSQNSVTFLRTLFYIFTQNDHVSLNPPERHNRKPCRLKEMLVSVLGTLQFHKDVWLVENLTFRGCKCLSMHGGKMYIYSYCSNNLLSCAN